MSETTDTELRDLLAKATPKGRWRAAEQTHSQWYGIQDDYFALGNIFNADDARLIVAAVNALPGLLDRVNERESEGWASYAAECERHAETTARADIAEAKLAALREGIARLIASPDDTQWWEVVPYMDPPEQDEVVEVAIVAVDRLRDLLGGE